MINIFCKDLEDAFAQMAYFGLLKEEDARCFGVVSHIKFNAFVLVAGAILLSFLTSFVCKAVDQYLRDEKQNRFNSVVHLSSETIIGDDEVGNFDLLPPVLFTDKFRWMLKHSDNVSSSDRTQFIDPNDSHWSLPEATIVASDSFPSDDRILQSTSVRESSTQKKFERALSSGSSLAHRGSIDQSSDISTELSYVKSLQRGKELKYYDNIVDKKLLKSERSEPVSSRQQSISSRMDSIGSSFDSENLGTFNLNNPMELSAAEVGAFRGSQGSRKPPPPAAYCLSTKSLKKQPPPQHFATDII